MPFQILRNDITKMEVDAIVSPANCSLSGGGGTDGAIHRAAGPGLQEECRALGGCAVGDAKRTRAYDLPCRWVIHTVGPRWQGGNSQEEALLRSCYRRSLALAQEAGCRSVAFPLISAGTHGYPKAEALRVASSEISAFLLEREMDVYLVLFGRESLELGQRLSKDIQEYIDDHYVSAEKQLFARRRETAESAPFSSEPWAEINAVRPDEICGAKPEHTEALPSEAAEAFEPKSDQVRPKLQSARPVSSKPAAPQAAAGAGGDLQRRIAQLDKSFQQMLLREIDLRGMTDAQCYKKANLDRKLFSKIRKDVSYRPSKSTAIAFAVALELDLEETESLLRKAGYALSDSSIFDVIIRYFIERKNYNIYEINEVLFAYDQSLLGSSY